MCWPEGVMGVQLWQKKRRDSSLTGLFGTSGGIRAHSWHPRRHRSGGRTAGRAGGAEPPPPPLRSGEPQPTDPQAGHAKDVTLHTAVMDPPPPLFQEAAFVRGGTTVHLSPSNSNFPPGVRGSRVGPPPPAGLFFPNPPASPPAQRVDNPPPPPSTCPPPPLESKRCISLLQGTHQSTKGGVSGNHRRSRPRAVVGLGGAL